MLKIIFCGSSNFLLNQLNIINKYKYSKIECIFIKKNKNIIFKEKIKKFLIKNNINLFIYNDINKDYINNLIKIKPDLVILSSYGLIIKKEMFKIPKYGFFNIHPSILPSYKGPAPIQWSIINNEKYLGVTLYKINENIDNGKIIYQEKYKIKKNKDYYYITNKLSNLGGILIKKLIYNLYNNNKIFFYTKNNINIIKNNFFYARKLSKKDSIINFFENSKTICNKIKVFIKWPKSIFNYKNNKIIILLAKNKFSNFYFEDFFIGMIILRKYNIYIITKIGILNLIKINFNNKLLNIKQIINYNIFINKDFVNIKNK